MSINFIVNESKAGAATARLRFEGLTAEAKTAENLGPRTSLETHRVFWHLRYRFNQ